MNKNFYPANTKGRDHLGDKGIDARLLLRLILEK
jgi:hypothetical protein